MPQVTDNCKHAVMLINYFTKWVEMALYADFVAEQLHTLSQPTLFGNKVPRELISNHWTHFKDETVRLLE